MDLIVLIIYIAILWVISIVVAVYDKIAAKRGARRIPERTLLWLSALGGAGGMLIVMKLIGHKTRKKKFMISLPLMIVLHIGLIAVYCHFRYPV